MKRGERILAGLDVGRCSTKVVIAAMVDEQIQVLGMGRASSRDTRHARTTSTADISEPLEEAMDAAEGSRHRDAFIDLTGQPEQQPPRAPPAPTARSRAPVARCSPPPSSSRS